MKKLMGLMAAAVLLVAAPQPGAAAQKFPDHYCKTFHARGYTIEVYAGKGVSCRTAWKIEREYWLAPHTQAHFRQLQGKYVALVRFPGWSCASGAGGGTCVKGNQVVGYLN